MERVRNLAKTMLTITLLILSLNDNPNFYWFTTKNVYYLNLKKAEIQNVLNFFKLLCSYLNISEKHALLKKIR